MTALRFGLIGPRRARQGLGPFVTKYLLESGAVVSSYVSTSPETLELSRIALDKWHQISARGYLSVSEMLAHEDLDALAILSPAETHERYLMAAVEAGLDVLCEKPIIWGDTGLRERAASIVACFENRNLLIRENCQWPYTLTGFHALYPDTLDAQLERFDMRLSPTAQGADMLRDALSHPLSILQKLAPDESPKIVEPGFDVSRTQISLDFEYVTKACRIGVNVDLMRAKTFPKEASYAINGHWARREVETPDYRIYLSSGDRRVSLRDPLAESIDDFLSAMRSDARTPDAGRNLEILQRIAMMERLVSAYESVDHRIAIAD